MEITVPRAVTHMLWNMSTDSGQLLWLCGICNEIQWVLISELSWCWLKGGKKHNKQANCLLLKFSGLFKKASASCRLANICVPSRSSVHRTAGAPHLWWMCCVRYDEHTLWCSPSWQNVCSQHLTCFTSTLYVKCSMYDWRPRLARIKRNLLAMKSVLFKQQRLLFFFSFYESNHLDRRGIFGVKRKNGINM